MNSSITVWILTQSMCDKYRLPFVKHFHGEPLAQYYEVSILWVHSFKMLIGKAGRIGFRALTLVLSNRTTVLWLFNFLNMNVNTDRIGQCEVHFAATKFWETNWLSEKDYHKKKNLLTGRKGSENSLTQHMLVNYTGMMCTLSSLKHNLYTVLLVLKLGW